MNDELSLQIHEGQGPPVLLVHGMLASRSQWLLNLDELSKVATPISIELWGHNESPSPEEPECYAPTRYVEMFEHIRRKLNVNEWFLGGCSLGASLTIRYALTYPEHVLGQFFTNSSSAFADDEMSRTWQENSEATYDRVMAGGLAALERVPVHPRNGKRLPERIRNALIADADQHSLAGIAGTMRWTSPFTSIRHRVHEVSVPSLLICGSKERRFQPLRTVVEERMPGVGICDLEAGHGVNMTAAAEFNANVTSFIKKTSKNHSSGH